MDWRIPLLVAFHSLCTTLANVGFKLSAASGAARGFWLWQAFGNLTGFGGVLALTFLMRLVPVHVAYPVTQGLSVIAVQLLSARLLFGESIAPQQWLGTALVVAGIMLIGSRP
jgi:undecaprenyl phosphate-alpha-L-ara4N flippase subunit ArnE